MEFSYENQGANTYLVYEVKESDEIDSLSLGMLTNNKIQGLAQTLFTQMDETRYIKYNVSSKVSVRQFFNGPVNKKRLLGVFNGIVDGLLSAEDYMIDSNAIVLDLDYIFADVSTCEATLICLPISNLERERTDLGVFFKNIMVNTQFDSTENSDHVAKIFNFLNSSPAFSLADFKLLLEEIHNNENMTEMLSNVRRENAAVQQQNIQQNTVNNQNIQQQLQQQVTPNQQIQSNPQVQSNQQVQSNPQVQPNQQIQPNSQIQQNQRVPQNLSMQQKQMQQPPKPMPNNRQMNIPNMNIPNQPVNKKTQAAPQQSNAEKEMSLFYLLQHYSAENAAVYKAQKAAKKAQTQNNMVQGNMAMPDTKNKHKKEKMPKPPKGQVQPGGFAVPGMAGNNGMAVPGMNGQQNFAMPGQQNLNIPTPQNNIQRQNTMSQQQPSQQPQVQAEIQNQQIPQPQQVKQPQPSQPSQPLQQPQPEMQGQQMNFGETTNLDMLMRGGTTVLNSSMRPPDMVSPHLIRIKTNENIMIDKPVFRIGKEKSYVDYFVSDNTAVSRSHANIVSRESKYYVMDTNSTNHTYLNGKMIQSNVEVELAHGDKIRLGNEDFEFMMY